MRTIDEVVERVYRHTGCGWRELGAVREDIAPLLLMIWLRGALSGMAIIAFAVAIVEWLRGAP